MPASCRRLQILSGDMCAHLQAEAASAVAGADPVIARNAGSLGARDLHLEDFSVSNGGPNLIEDASIMMAFGRRYGLVS
jgi:ATP-binding cassette, subfamily F, member 3